MRKPKTKPAWEEVALDPNHPDQPAAVKFLEVVSSSQYRLMRDPSMVAREWNFFLAGWKRAHSTAAFSGTPHEMTLHGAAQCELSKSICLTLQEALLAAQRENESLRSRLSAKEGARPTGSLSCARCGGGFEPEDVIPLCDEFFPIAADSTFGEDVVRVTLSLPNDFSEWNATHDVETKNLCNSCLEEIARAVTTQMIEQIRLRKTLLNWYARERES
jgi:hypothetical protein